MNYSAAIWSPLISESSNNLQNLALRIATGCHLNIPISHLHHESKVTLVKDHLELLSSQYLLSCSRTSHPSHQVVRQPPGARRMKQTLLSKHSHKVNRFLTDGVLDPVDYKKLRDALHTEAVASTISKLGNNPVLEAPPPPIAPSEATLTRRQRSTLSQLRSGQCHLLNDYLVLTGRSDSAICPECLIRRHTVNHLFNCDAASTTLTTLDLWKNPVLVTTFLKTLPSFSCLEPTVPPPQPDPPP